MSWKTMLQKQRSIRQTLMLAKGVDDVEFVVITKDPGKPKVKTDAEGVTRIDPAWFEANITPEAYRNQCLYACFLFSVKDGNAWGVESGLRGSHIRDIDDIGELWIKADENTIESYPDGVKWNRFEKTLPHEIGHDLKYRGITNRDVHEFDYKRLRHDIGGFYKQTDFRHYSTLYESQKTVYGVLTKLRVLKSGGNPIFPVNPKYRTHLTQAFGVKNTRYKSGIHNGDDLWLPIGTPIHAVADGEIVDVYPDHPSMGNAIYFKYGTRYIRFLHLSHTMPKGVYKKGDIIGHSGNSGDSTGAHLHWEVWRVPINVALLNSESSVRGNLLPPSVAFSAAV